MPKFDNVSVVKKANVYFDGKVSSRTVLLGNGEAKTLGFMQPGEFEFNTNQKECMELLAGQWDVQGTLKMVKSVLPILLWEDRFKSE